MAKKSNNMIIDPYFEGLLLEKYPHLGEIFVADGVDIEKALRYLSLAYDPNSPLVGDYPDIAKRRLRAAAIVGTKVKEVPDVFTPLFLKNVVKSMDWTFIASLENAFDEFSEIINDRIKRDGSDDEILKATEKKGKLWREMKALKEEIRMQKQDFFNGEEEVEEKFLYNPQNIAKATKT